MPFLAFKAIPLLFQNLLKRDGGRLKADSMNAMLQGHLLPECDALLGIHATQGKHSKIADGAAALGRQSASTRPHSLSHT